jgi:hypothetical protein
MQIMMDHKQLQSVEYFKYSGSMRTVDARCRRDLNPRLPWQKEKAFYEETELQFKEETREVLHLERSFVWC